MKKLFTILFVATINLTVVAQHQTDKWYFGLNAGLDFSSGTPVVLDDGQLNGIEGCASISDSSGNLLFYTDGMTVWNKTHQVMQNGSGLLGGISVQSSIIVPLPGSTSIYYIFTNDVADGPNGLEYSVVDMSLDSGRGEVISQNSFLQDNLTERLTAVANDQLDAYWITAHEYGSDLFHTYKLTSAGLDTIVVYNFIGNVHSTVNLQNAYGQMKYSPCGNKLAVAIGYMDTVEVFDFDNSTGVLSNPIDIPMPDHVFGLEFSPDGQKIYVSTYAAATLYQFDLSSNDTATIHASSTALSIANDTYGLQLASDGKIYVAKSYSPFLGIINDPDVAGPSCNYVDAGINIDPQSLNHVPGLCLPGFVQSFFRTATSCLINRVDELGSSNAMLFPNPTSTEFNLTLMGVSDVYVFDIKGSLIRAYSHVENKLDLGKDFASGVYFIRIQTSTRMQVVKAVKL